MRRVIEALILFYQRMPRSHRRCCLFRESCSNYVLRRLREDGVVAAGRAFAERWARCRPGYRVRWDLYSGVPTVRLADGSEIRAGEMAPTLRSRIEAVQ